MSEINRVNTGATQIGDTLPPEDCLFHLVEGSSVGTEPAVIEAACAKLTLESAVTDPAGIQRAINEATELVNERARQHCERGLGSCAIG